MKKFFALSGNLIRGIFYSFFTRMRGIKKYTHKEREKILHEMIPLIKRKFGKNLLAVAARGSFARNTDQPYSDLELFAFLKEMPRGQKKENAQNKKRSIC